MNDDWINYKEKSGKYYVYNIIICFNAILNRIITYALCIWSWIDCTGLMH